MNASRHVWMVFFVGFDDSGTNQSGAVVPYVGRERVNVADDPEQMLADLELAAFLRGGQVMAVVADDEANAEHTRAAIELQVFRHR